MGLFDSLGDLFSSGSSAGASSAGPSWVSLIGPLISQIHATPNPGATRGDMARASRINLLSGLLGGLATAYGEKQRIGAQTEANKSLFDILARGGGEQAVEAAGPVMPGMERPNVMSKIPMSKAFAELGAKNPLVQDSALKLALAAQDNERNDSWNQQKFDRENQWHSDEVARQKEAQAAQNAYHNASLGLQRKNMEWEHKFKERELDNPLSQMAKIRAAYGDDVANEWARTQSGAGNAPAQLGQPQGGNVAALMDAVANKKAAAAGIERLDKINNDPALRSATEEYRKGRQALESVAELINTGELQGMDRQMIAKRLVQAIEPGNSVNAGEAEAALSRMGTAGVYVKNWIDDMFANGTRLGPEQIKRALDQLAVNVGSQRRSALDFINNKRQYGAATGVTQEQLPLIGNGFVDGGDPSELASKAWSLYEMGQQRGADPDLLKAQRALFKKRFLGGR